MANGGSFGFQVGQAVEVWHNRRWNRGTVIADRGFGWFQVSIDGDGRSFQRRAELLRAA